MNKAPRPSGSRRWHIWIRRPALVACTPSQMRYTYNMITKKYTHSVLLEERGTMVCIVHSQWQRHPIRFNRTVSSSWSSSRKPSLLAASFPFVFGECPTALLSSSFFLFSRITTGPPLLSPPPPPPPLLLLLQYRNTTAAAWRPSSKDTVLGRHR